MWLSDVIQLRRIRETDAPAIAELAASDPAFDLSRNTRFFPLEYLREWFRDPRDDVLYCAEDGHHRIIGFVLCQTIRGRWAIWHNLFVVPEHRRAGVGQALFSAAMSDLRAKGIAQSVSFVSDPGALPFYEANGATVGRSLTYVEWSGRR